MSPFFFEFLTWNPVLLEGGLTQRLPRLVAFLNDPLYQTHCGRDRPGYLFDWNLNLDLLAEPFYNVKYGWPIISGVLLRRQLMKRQLSRQMFVRKLLFLVCCFFSVIWNISQINVFKTKCKLKCQNNFFGKLFLKSWNASVYFLCFHYWDLSDEHLTW